MQQILLIDITRLFYRKATGRLPTGIDRVCIEYLRHFGCRARAVLSLGPFSSVLSSAMSRRAMDLLLSRHKPRWATILTLVAAAVVTGWTGRGVRGLFLLNTGHFGLENSRYAMILRRSGVRPIYMVHDLIPITHPEYCRPGENVRHVKRIQNMLAQCSGVIANSQDTLFALASFCRERGLRHPCNPVVAPLAPGLMTGPERQFDTTRPYFVCLGTIEPRKNHVFLLNIWRRLVDIMGNDAPLLILIGQRGWECENVVDMLERCECLNDHVVELSGCTDADLRGYLKGCRALVFPSFVEGYGLPLVEAVSLGAPVIASDLSVFREICGDIPDYLDALDGTAWIETIQSYSQENCSERQYQLERIAQFSPPTWTDHFAIIENYLDQLDTLTLPDFESSAKDGSPSTN